MNACHIVKTWRAWLFGLALACLGAPALAWDDALIQAVYSVTFGRATEAQKALVFANNKVVNQMAMTNIIDNKAYQASQKLFSDINNTFIQKAANEAGLKAGLQTPSGEGYNPGTDTDVLVDSAKQGEKITLENIKKAEEAYQRQLRQFLENRGVKPPPGKIDTQTDFMPNSRSTTPSEFTKINQHINANGGTAYESPGAADVEWKMRLDKNDPLRKLNINETGEYMSEMQRLAKEKLGHAEALEAEAKQALKTDPAKARGLQSDAQLARSQAGKYMQRMEKVSNELAKQHGVPGVPKSQGPLGQSVENISKGGRGFETRGDAATIGKYGEAGVNKGVKDYAETLSKIAANSKDPKAIAEAQRLIAEQTKNMKPDMREYIAKKAKEAFKGEGKAAEEFEKGLTKEMDKQAAKAATEGAGKGGTEGAAKGGTEGAAKGGTEGAAKGGTEGAAKGGTEGATKGGTEGAAKGGTEGAAKGGTEGAAKGGAEGAAKGGTEGAAKGGTEGAAQGGTEGAAKGGTEGAAKGGTEGAAKGGTEGAAKGGTEGAAKGGTEGAAKGGAEGAAKGGAEGAAKGGTEGAAQGGTEGAAKGGTEGAAKGGAEGAAKGGTEGAAQGGTEGAAKGGTEGAAKGGTEGAAQGGTEGAAKGGAEGAAQGGTEGAAKGGAEGAAQGGTEGAAKGGTEGAAKGGAEGAAKGGAEGAAQGGTEGAAKGGTEGAAKGGAEGAAKGGTEGAAQGGTEGAAKGGTEGAAKGGTEGAAKGGAEGAAKGGAEGAAEGGAEGAASGLGAKVKTGLKILGPLLILHDGSGKITQAWKAKDTDKPQVAIEGGGEFVGATGGAMAGAAAGASLGAMIGTAVPIVGNFAGGIIGGIVGGVAGYMGGGMAGRAAGEELANALGVKQDAYLPDLLANADHLYKGLLAKGVPPDKALEAAKLLLGGKLGDFSKYMSQLRDKYGAKGGYVTSHHSQKDWYCTNRPEIIAPVILPPILQLMGAPPVPIPLPLPDTRR